MPYRTTTERPPEEPLQDEEKVDAAWCTRCNAAVPSQAERCPQCLRRSSVVASRGVVPAGAAAADRPRPVVWPYTRTCPLCTSCGIDDSFVYLRVAKVASGFGSLTVSLVVRVRCCAPCRRRVERLEWLRYAGAASLLGGMFLLLLLFVPGWSRLLGVLGALLVAVPLVTLTRANRSLRAGLDAAGICDRLALEVPDPSGIFEWENRVLHARVASDRKLVDLAEVLQVASRPSSYEG